MADKAYYPEDIRAKHKCHSCQRKEKTIERLKAEQEAKDKRIVELEEEKQDAYDNGYIEGSDHQDDAMCEHIVKPLQAENDRLKDWVQNQIDSTKKVVLSHQYDRICLITTVREAEQALKGSE